MENKTALTPVQAEPANQTQSVLALIARAATDPNINVDVMERMLAMQQQVMAKQAEVAFNQALATIQGQLPRISKDAKIVHNGKTISTYSTYENIDNYIRPLLIEHGFSLRFNSEQAADGKAVIVGTLAHAAGHSVTNKITLGIDSSGAKNNVQGMGSTIAYGKRYLVGMLLNLVFEGEDDDGQKGGSKPVTDAQAAEIKKLLEDSGADTVKFLAYVGAPNVDAMDASMYAPAVAMLRSKLASKGAAK